jgi:hypothetical protein
VACSSDDGDVRIWETGSNRCVKTLTQHVGGTHTVAFSGDDRLLAIGSGDGAVHVWNGECWWSHLCCQKGHENPVQLLTFGVGGEVLTSGGLDLTIRVWDLKTTVCLFLLDCYDFCKTSGMEHLKFTNMNGSLELRGADNSRRVWILEPAVPESSPRSMMWFVDMSASPSPREITGGKIQQIHYKGGVLTMDSMDGSARAFFTHDVNITAACSAR